MSESGGEFGDGLAPVIPLFGGRNERSYPKTAAETRRQLEDRLPTVRVRTQSGEEPGTDESGADATDAAERGLLKKLRARQLSVSEARAYLARQEVEPHAAEALIDAFVRRGYLDDARLAEQVVHAGVDRKGQGRQVIAQSLAQRGVPRDVADAALAELPDDDAERALEYARAKAGSMRGLERDAALRRLAGQLARRGYASSVSLNAARAALDEVAPPSGRVRFEEG